MTGPFAVFSTFRSGDISFFGGGAAATFSVSEVEQPVITATEPMSALRMRNVLRSTPAGISFRFKSGRKSALLRRCSDFIVAPENGLLLHGSPFVSNRVPIE